MNAPVAFKFIEEIRHRCAFAQQSFRDLKSALNSMDKDAVLRHVHSFLDHAHAVSRLLWPARESSKERGDWLRKELAVEDGSPLRLPDMRRQLEADDECYEDWLNDLADKNYVDSNVMPESALGSQPRDSFHRSLDPDTFKFYLRGAACNVQTVAKALQSLDTAAATWLRKHNPW